MMRLSSLGHESGVAAGGRLKTREERGMGSRPPSISTSFDHASESDDDDDADANESASVTDARSPEAASFGSYATASPLLIHKAASALWHAPPSLHGHHDLSTNCSTNDMNGGTWRDVVISSSAGNHDELPPLGSTVTPTPATSKRKKTKKEVFVCHEPNCGKQFPRSFALRRHMRIHTGTKPYACDHDGCTQRFNTSGNLSRHKRIHSGERPYPCIFSTCGKKFNTSTKLKRHMRIHFPEGQNVFRCVGLNCSWSCDNYKEFAAHQKLQHNIIVGAGLEAVSAAAAAAIASATGTSDHGMDTQYGDTSANSDTQGYASNGYMYGYGKPSTLPPPSSSQSRKQTSSSNASGSNSSQQYNYDTSFASLSGLARETKHKTQDIGDHLYDHYRRTKSSSSNGYTLPTTSFPPADAAGSHYASSRGSAGLSSMYESGSSLTMSSESSSYGAPSLRTGSLFNHTLGRHDDSVFKTEHDNGHNDHQSHTHAHTSSAHHHILRPPPPSSHHDHDGMKFAVPPPMNPAAPEFTGEELSVVLELMKDSYY